MMALILVIGAAPDPDTAGTTGRNRPGPSRRLFATNILIGPITPLAERMPEIASAMAAAIAGGSPGGDAFPVSPPVLPCPLVLSRSR